METDQTVHPDAAHFGGWSWREPMRGEHFRRCSYCGSVHPEDLAAEPFWVPNWADQKYGWPHKFYVDIPNREPDQLFVTSTVRSEQPPQETLSGVPWVAVADLTPEQRAVAERDGYLKGERPPNYFEFRPRATHFGKFYTVHLSDNGVSAEVKKLIEQRSGLAFEFTDGRVAWRSV